MWTYTYVSYIEIRSGGRQTGNLPCAPEALGTSGRVLVPVHGLLPLMVSRIAQGHTTFQLMGRASGVRTHRMWTTCSL
jgi:hypothetical protein